MKSIHSIIAKSAALLSFTVIAADALGCGPFLEDVPTPDFIEPRWEFKIDDYRREENIARWQALTSSDIPAEDVYLVVYKAPLAEFLDSVKAPDTPGSNRFYSYLRNSHDSEVIDFLTLAKEIETYRFELVSPWYYPSSRQYKTEAEVLDAFTDRCLSYTGDRLRDRYGLQAIRSIFSTRQYERCIAAFDSIFADIPVDNLFRRMSLDYVMGCMSNLGREDEADDYFDQSGDVESIKNKESKLYNNNIDLTAYGWIHYIRRNINNLDSINLMNAAKMYSLQPDVTYKGDWLYFMSYLSGEKFGNYQQARKYADAALREEFFDVDLRDLAQAYRLKVSGFIDDRSTLLDDLRYLEAKIVSKTDDSHFWNRILQNAIYTSWVPTLWSKGQYADMALLCNYADNLEGVTCDIPWYYYPYDSSQIPFDKLPSQWTGIGRLAFERSQYNTLSFRLLESLKVNDIARIASNLRQSTPLYRHLKRYSGLSDDFLNELAGTLAIRNSDYPTAVRYLSLVSPEYLEKMKIFGHNYLARNPFYLGTTGRKGDGKANYCPAVRLPQFESLATVSPKIVDYTPDAKIRFARQMLRLERMMNTASSPDVRAMAKFLYAQGHRNSFFNCWALTQYWKGVCCEIFYPYMDYSYDLHDYIRPEGKCFNRLYDFDESYEPEYIRSLYTTRVYEIMNSSASDDVKAQIAYLDCNPGDVMRTYPETMMAQIIRTHCDGLKDWIRASSADDDYDE